MSDTKLKVITPLVRISYPHIATPQKANEPGKKDKYSVSLIIEPQTLEDPKEKALFDAMYRAGLTAIAAKFGEANVQKLLQSDTFKKGFRKDAESKGYKAGSIFVNARSEQRPGCVYSYADPNTKLGEKPRPAVVPDDKIRDTFYPGCYARASVTAFGYDKNGNKGLGWALNNLQFVRDGERIDGRVAAEDEFVADLTQTPQDLASIGL